MLMKYFITAVQSIAAQPSGCPNVLPEEACCKSLYNMEADVSLTYVQV